MGEGFVVMMSNLVELYFYMDEPGLCFEGLFLLIALVAISYDFKVLCLMNLFN